MSIYGHSGCTIYKVSSAKVSRHQNTISVTSGYRSSTVRTGLQRMTSYQCSIVTEEPGQATSCQSAEHDPKQEEAQRHHKVFNELITRCDVAK